MVNPRSPLVAVVGPTAVGKTAIAVRLAQDFDGVIVAADSRQVYRLMNIGTAKPTADELAHAPHKLVDILDPDQELSLARFQAMAYKQINLATAKGKLPLLVGGTGQYVKAVVEGWGIPEVAPNIHLRSDLLALADMYSSTVLHEWLASIDKQAATSIDYRNIRRVVRAIEVYIETGTPISELQKREPPPYQILMLGLTRPRDALFERVDSRVDAMMAGGFVNEVQNLLMKGYSWGLPAMSSLGYPDIGAYLNGEINLEEAANRIKRDTRHFIRRQYNWFRLDDPQIRWFDLSTASYAAVSAAVSEFLQQRH
jgi:tRNA dimethylallyltransferase